MKEEFSLISILDDVNYKFSNHYIFKRVLGVGGFGTVV